MQVVAALLSGWVFGLGLLVSGMANPQKVLGFLDLAGPWDPSLALVMAGAIAVGLPAFSWARRLQARHLPTYLGLPVQLPEPGPIDRRLLWGGALFGVGWGLAGLCPGPALVALGTGQAKALVFVLAMLAGMGVFEVWQKRRTAKG
jgi:uncharacterized protein